jgi:hypothetical protein
MEGKIPDAPQDVERLFAWFSGIVAVPSFNVIVSGRREDVPTEFGLFACLYPDAPYYRAYMPEAALTDADKLRQARRDIAEIRLPDDSERRYQERMQRNAPLVGPAAAWSAAELVARNRGIPHRLLRGRPDHGPAGAAGDALDDRQRVPDHVRRAAPGGRPGLTPGRRHYTQRTTAARNEMTPRKEVRCKVIRPASRRRSSSFSGVILGGSFDSSYGACHHQPRSPIAPDYR